MGSIMMTGNRGEDEAMCDINVTPFVDVLLVLLVIFMITAPIINQMIQIDLPQDSYQQDGAPLEKTMRVLIDRKGVIYVNDEKIGEGLSGSNWDKFQKIIREWTTTKKGPVFVDVEADENAKYSALIPVIARLKEMNVGLNLVIAPDTES